MTTIEELDRDCPDHDKLSCSDDHPVNAGVDFRYGHTWCRRCQGLWTIKADAALDHIADRLAERGASDGRMSDETRAWLEGMSVSVDVSTCDADAQHRYMGTITEVMDDRGDKHGVTLLVQDAEPNFERGAGVNVPKVPEDVRDALLLLDMGQGFALCNTDHAGTRRDVEKLRKHIDVLLAYFASAPQPAAQQPAGDGVAFALFEAYEAADKAFDETQSRRQGFGFTNAAPYSEQAAAMRLRESCRGALIAALRANAGGVK